MSTERREVSHGGLVVRGDELVVIVPRYARTLTLPKGGAEMGEDSVQAATREVREETGLVAEPICALGHVDYGYRRKGHQIAKTVHFHLFAYRSGTTDDHDDEVREARWMALERARTALTFPGERTMVERAMAKLAETGADQLGSRP